MKTVSVRQLKNNPSVALREARERPVMVLNRHRPEALLVHLDEDSLLTEPGIRLALATALFREQSLSLGQAARFSGAAPAEFIRHVSRLGIPVVRGTAATVHEDTEAIRPFSSRPEKPEIPDSRGNSPGDPGPPRGRGRNDGRNDGGNAMNEYSNPKQVHPPLGAYSHTVKVPPNATWLILSGQVGINASGKLQTGLRRQAEQVFRNILACLRANRMKKEDLVKLVVYLTDSRFVEEYRAARAKVLGGDVLPASTLLVIDGLAHPDMLIEVEAWAAKG